MKIYGGANAGCSAINAGCTAGVSVGIEGNESISHERKNHLITVYYKPNI